MVTNQEWEKLWTFNKKVIDPVCPRHTAVKSEGNVLLKLKDVAHSDYVTLPKHKKNPEAGKKTTLRSPEIWLDQEDAALLQEGEEVTLMDWGNAIVERIDRDNAGAVTSMEGRTNLEGDVKKTKWKLTWLAKSEELLPLSLQDFDHLLSKKRLEDEDDILQLLTVCSRWEVDALGDSNMRQLQKGNIIQLERKGYFIVDEPYIRPGRPMVLLAIPDGRKKEPQKPAEAVKAAEAVAAQRQAKLEAARREEEAAALKAAAPQKENAKAANKKKKAANEARQEDASMQDPPVSTKVTIEVEPANGKVQPTKSASSSQTQASDGRQTSLSDGNSKPRSVAEVLQGNRSAEPSKFDSKSLSKGSSSEMPKMHDTASSSGVSFDSADSPERSTILKLEKVVEEIVSDSGAKPQTSPSGTQPIAVPSPRRIDADKTASIDRSVPATPTNTPQTNFGVPQRNKPVDFSGAKLFPFKQATRGSVPPTPANTPQRSGELPASAGRQQPPKSPLNKLESDMPE